MKYFKKKQYLQILFIFCILILIVAFYLEYILGYEPCNLCIIERIPYALAILILILNYKYKKNHLFFSILLLLTFSFSLIISAYHLGIEQGWISESLLCGSNNMNLISKEEIIKSLNELNISCKDVTLRIFGLSLTTYNIFLSLLMIFISTKIYLLKNGN